MNYKDQKIGINAKQARDYKLKLALFAGFFTAISACTSTPANKKIDENIYQGNIKPSNSFNKLRTSHPEYHWEFVERSVSQ